jgi:hypothetical protein
MVTPSSGGRPPNDERQGISSARIASRSRRPLAWAGQREQNHQHPGPVASQVDQDGERYLEQQDDLAVVGSALTQFARSIVWQICVPSPVRVRPMKQSGKNQSSATPQE